MPDPPRSTRWRWSFVAGFAIVVAYLSLPTGRPGGLAVWAALSLAVVAALLGGVRHHHRLTFYDQLTGLPNRARLLDRVARAVAAAQRDGTTPSLAVIDIDGFKEVNQTYGQRVGDILLAEVGARIEETVAAEGVVARFAGDKFAVLLGDGGVRAVSTVAQSALRALREPYRVDGRELILRADAGAAALASGGSTDDLVHHADVAMYTSRAQGLGELHVFSSARHGAVLDRLSLTTDLRSAVRENQLTLHYQPIVEVGSGRPVGVEALVRWEHPVRGPIPPDGFIALAERTGTIHELGRWVLETACRQCAAWSRAGHDVYVSVNLSGAQLRNPRFVEEVREVLERTSLPPEALALEITESSVVEDAENTIPALERLRETGISLVIDDFGTGYSSLSYLRRLPVDVVKIDRSFIAGITAASAEWSVALAIVRLVQSLGMRTVAEGVETGGQLAHLRALGCDLAQGYYFARPATADEVVERFPTLGRA